MSVNEDEIRNMGTDLTSPSWTAIVEGVSFVADMSKEANIMDMAMNIVF